MENKLASLGQQQSCDVIAMLQDIQAKKTFRRAHSFTRL